MRFKESKDTLEVFFIGEVDHYQVSQWRESTQAKIINSKAKTIIFDFAEVSFIDSTGIGFILGRYKDLQKSKKELYLRNCIPSVHRLFEMSGLFTLMKVV